MLAFSILLSKLNDPNIYNGRKFFGVLLLHFFVVLSSVRNGVSHVPHERFLDRWLELLLHVRRQQGPDSFQEDVFHFAGDVQVVVVVDYAGSSVLLQFRLAAVGVDADEARF